MTSGILGDLFQTKSLSNILRSLVSLLVASAMLEFFLLRIFRRMGTILPEGELAGTIYSFSVFSGLIAFNMAFLLSTIVLGLIALKFTQGSRLSVAISILLFSTLAAGIVLAFETSSIVSLIYYIMSLLILTLALIVSKQQRVKQTPLSLFVAAAYSCSYYYLIASYLANLGLALPFASELLSLGELLALIVPIAAFYILRSGWDWRGIAVAFSTVPIFLVASRSPLLPLITTWAVYFTLHLPIPFYAIALWFYTYMIIDFLKHKRLMAYSLLYIALAGRMLQTTYLNQLALLGFLLLTLPVTNFSQ